MNGFSRVEPTEMVRETSFPLRNGWAGIVACFCALTFTASIITFSWIESDFGPLGGVAFVLAATAGLSSLIFHRFDKDSLQLEYEYRKCLAANADSILQLGKRPVTDAGDVDCRHAAWVCTAEEFKRVVAAHSNSYVSPKVEHKRVIGTRPASGSNQRMAFADGSTATWHRGRHLYIENRPARISNRSIDVNNRLAMLIPKITDILTSGFLADGRWILCGYLREQSGISDPREFLLILHVTKAWGLIEFNRHPGWVALILWPFRSGTSITRRMDTLSARASKAGRVWSEIPHELERRRATMKARQPKPTINFNNSSINNSAVNFGDDSEVVATNLQFTSSASEILELLSDMLRRTGIPWNDTRLAGDRAVIADAVEKRDPQHPRVAEVIARLGSLCGDALTTVLGEVGSRILLSYFNIAA